MIGQYRYVGGDIRNIKLDGNVLPVRGDNTVRGEDIVFLLDGCLERMAIIGSNIPEDNSYPFTASIEAEGHGTIDDAFTKVRSMYAAWGTLLRQPHEIDPTDDPAFDYDFIATIDDMQSKDATFRPGDPIKAEIVGKLIEDMCRPIGSYGGSVSTPYKSASYDAYNGRLDEHGNVVGNYVLKQDATSLHGTTTFDYIANKISDVRIFHKARFYANVNGTHTVRYYLQEVTGLYTIKCGSRKITVTSSRDWPYTMATDMALRLGLPIYEGNGGDENYCYYSVTGSSGGAAQISVIWNPDITI